MTIERWRQIEQIYQAAADLDAREQRAFLDTACGSDCELRAIINRLLSAGGGFDMGLEAAIRDEAEALASNASELIVGERIGPYRITAVIAIGGMGAVYRAARDDDQYHKEVAIKVIKRGMDLDAVVRRFRKERQILARLEHPNIARLIDGGVTEDGQPYFVMEYVEGLPLTEYCESLPLKERLHLFRQVCGAVQYAHENRIVHRDVKPANILVGKDGVVKLLDFGLAKVLSPDELPEQTYTFLRMLTPDYASPEQVRGEPITPRSDVYSLGAILYELISQRRAHQFNDRTTAEIERVICDENPPRIAGEQGSIVRMAMHKEPEQRYASAQQLSEDIHRYFEGLPLLARNCTIGYRLGKFARRNKATVICSLCFSLLSSTIVVSVLSRGSLSVRTMDLPLIPIQLTTYAGDERRAALSPQGTHVVFEWDGGEEKNFDLYVRRLPAGEPIRLTRDPNPDLSPAWSPDGKRIAFLRALQNGRADLVIVAADGGPEQKLLSFLGPVRYLLEDGASGGGVTWGPDGRTFVLSVREAEHRPYRLVHFDPERRAVEPLTDPPQGMLGDWAPSISPDGERLVFQRVNGATVSEIFLLPLTNGMKALGAPKQLTSLGVVSSAPTWAPDRLSVLFSSNVLGSDIIQRVAVSGGAVRQLGIGGASPTTASKSDRVVYQSSFSDLNVWRVPLTHATPTRASTWAPSSRADQNAQFSPDGRQVAFQSDRSGSPEIYVANAGSGNIHQVTSAGGRRQGTPRWSPDGKYLSFDANVSANNWEVFVMAADGSDLRQLTVDPAPDGVPAWSRDGQWLYFTSFRTGRPEIWKISPVGGIPVRVTRNGGFSALESPDGKTLFYTRTDGVAALFRMPVAGGPEQPVLSAVYARSVCITPHGIYYVSPESNKGNSIRLLRFDRSSSELILSVDKPIGPGLSVSPDSKWLLYSQLDQSRSDLMFIEHLR